MAQKDYYSILGVTKSATADEIKKAYRKKALEFHPDRNKDKGAADKFKEVSSAYEVLSNPQKRQTYDQYGEAAFKNGGGNPGAGGPFQYTYSTNAQDFADMFGGTDPFEDIFSTVFGGAQRRAQMPHYSMTITFKEAMEGVQKSITHDNKKQTISIPKGVEDGTTIRFQTFQVTFRVKPSDTFQRDGQDLYVDVSLPFTLFLLGGDIKVPTLEGNITIKVRPQTEPNGMLRLSGRGAPYINSNHRGDLYIRLKPNLPNKLSREQKSLLNDLKETGI